VLRILGATPISTTTRWVNYIRKDWATYVAARTEDTKNRAGFSATLWRSTQAPPYTGSPATRTPVTISPS
jgi:hypothetical protein